MRWASSVRACPAKKHTGKCNKLAGSTRGSTGSSNAVTKKRPPAAERVPKKHTGKCNELAESARGLTGSSTAVTKRRRVPEKTHREVRQIDRAHGRVEKDLQNSPQTRQRATSLAFSAHAVHHLHGLGFLVILGFPLQSLHFQQRPSAHRPVLPPPSRRP